MRIEVNNIIPSNLWLLDSYKPLSPETMYYVACAEIGHDKINSRYTLAPVTAFGSTYIVNSYSGIAIKFSDLDERLTQPGMIMIFISKDDITYQPVELIKYKDYYCLVHEPLISSPKFSKCQLQSSTHDNEILGTRNPEEGEWKANNSCWLTNPFTFFHRYSGMWGSECRLQLVEREIK